MLYFITDGDIHSVVYLMQNGIYPDKYALETESFKDQAPFVTSDDEVIVLVQGFVRWTLTRLKMLIELLEQSCAKFTIYSTVELPINTKYTRVSGDLVYGVYREYENRKMGRPYKANINDRYKAYDKAKQPSCFDSLDSSSEDIQVYADDSISNQLVAVDIRNRKID